MIICIGSSTKLAQGLESITNSHDEVTYFGRSNPFRFNKWVMGEDLSSLEGIEKYCNKLSSYLLNEVSKKETNIHLVLLNGLSSNDWNASINVNLLASVKLAEVVAKHITKIKIAGSITLIGSASSYLGGKTSYSATKASLFGLMNSLNAEYKPNLRVNLIIPGAIESGMTEDWSTEKKRNITNYTNQNRLATSLEIAHSILFCTQNTYLSGAIINMTDGVVK